MNKLICSFLLFLICNGLLAQDLLHIKIDSINSTYDEFNPMLSPDGTTLYVTRRGHASNIAGVIDQGDIWYARSTQEGWTPLIHAGDVINHQGLNGVVGFSADGQRMYLLNYFDSDGNGGGNLRQGISVSSLVGGEWTKPERLSIKFFQNNSSHLSATISKDEKILIISMASFTTEGNEDLYVSFKKENGEWTQPKGLGNTVNTFAEEWTPFLASDNRTLYFASNGFEGFGSRDIYMTKRNEGSWINWSTPVNLGETINTEGVELGFYVPLNSKEAYFSTTQNSEGMGDIFRYPLADQFLDRADDQTIIVQVKENDKSLIDEESATEMVVMNFEVIDARTERPISSDADVVMTFGPDQEIFNTRSLEGSRQFMKAFEVGTQVQVNIKAEGYLDYNSTFEVKATAIASGDEFGSAAERFMLTRKEVGTSMKIDNVLFMRGSASFSNAEVAEGEINKLIELMKNNPQMQIRLEGHTDNRGDARILKSLSEERVKTVRRYMVSQGVDKSRIDIVGYGGERPIAANDTPTSREINRRVEFVIIK